MSAMEGYYSAIPYPEYRAPLFNNLLPLAMRRVQSFCLYGYLPKVNRFATYVREFEHDGLKFVSCVIDSICATVDSKPDGHVRHARFVKELQILTLETLQDLYLGIKAHSAWNDLIDEDVHFLFMQMTRERVQAIHENEPQMAPQ